MSHKSASEPEPAPDVEPFRFENTEVFRKTLELANLADDLAMRHRRTRPWLGYQLGKTGLSVLNNTGEAIGEYSPGDKARFFRYALRSGSEFGAMIAFMAGKGLIHREAEIAARRLTVETMKIIGRKAIFFHRRSRRRDR